MAGHGFEKLRLKIIARLCKEGSSAEEPLNIILSDYSSDTGDTSSASSSSENNGRRGVQQQQQQQRRRRHIDDSDRHCFREPFKVPPTSPVLPPAAAGRSKKTIALKQAKHKLRTHSAKPKLTRPVLDIPTTDPGLDLPYGSATEDDFESDIEGWETFPTKLNRAVFLRRIDPAYYDKKMPPELIITSAKKGDASAVSCDDNQPTPLPSSTSIINEFPPISRGKPKRKVCVHFLSPSKSVVHRGNEDAAAESLQMELSLKKNVWRGAWPEPNRYYNRPLSFGGSRTTQDSTALLAACSKKLASLKCEEIGTPAAACQSRQRIKSGAGCRTLMEPLASKEVIFHEQFVKPKRRTKHFFGRTTQLMSQLGGQGARRRSTTVAGGTSLSVMGPLAMATMTTTAATRNRPNKFKTGGLVATAVQPIKTKAKAKAAAADVAAKATAKVVDVCSCPESENEKLFVKKIKTKLKKKKK